MANHSIGRLLAFAQAPSVLMVAYLDLLGIAALRRQKPPIQSTEIHSFAILVPAHNEQLLLPRLLDNLQALDYPRSRFNIYVVADNCEDDTAAVARASGAEVYERTNKQRRGKGQALSWLLDQIAEQYFDGYVVIDADSRADLNLLRVFNDHLSRGDAVVQCYYGVLNRDESWLAALRSVAFALYNGVRPRGREALGLSAGLRGNGMCFSHRIIKAFGWPAYSRAEDAELHLTLVSAGVRVRFAAGTMVVADMPTTLRQARSQDMRWEGGRQQVLRQFAATLLSDGLRGRDLVRFDALAEQCIPPLSVLTGIAAAMVALTTLLKARGARRLALVVALGEVGYVTAGLRVADARAREYGALALAPFFIAWKIFVYARALLSGDRRWIRTERRLTYRVGGTGDSVPT